MRRSASRGSHSISVDRTYDPVAAVAVGEGDLERLGDSGERADESKRSSSVHCYRAGYEGYLCEKRGERSGWWCWIKMHLRGRNESWMRNPGSAFAKTGLHGRSFLCAFSTFAVSLPLSAASTSREKGEIRNNTRAHPRAKSRSRAMSTCQAFEEKRFFFPIFFFRWLRPPACCTA